MRLAEEGELRRYEVTAMGDKSRRFLSYQMRDGEWRFVSEEVRLPFEGPLDDRWGWDNPVSFFWGERFRGVD